MPHIDGEVEGVKRRVRAYLDATGMSLSALAEKAGLHRNTLRHVWLARWNPRVDTLARLEDAIPPDFSGPDGRARGGGGRPPPSRRSDARAA